MRPVITQEDKKLVGYLTKKKKSSGKSVYFNKKSSTTGKAKYLTGKFYSKKNNRMFIYRSSYELRFFHMLEEDSRVRSYEVETLKIPYKDLDGSFKNYIPDVVVLLNSGDIRVCEIKPNAMLDNVIVKRKAQACRTYFKKMLGDSTINYEYIFITETHLFKNASDYALFLKEHSNLL